jgi:hypothetical protein
MSLSLGLFTKEKSVEGFLCGTGLFHMAYGENVN